jgi:hypothetical protein
MVCSLLAEANPNGPGCVDQFAVGIDGLHFSDGLGYINTLDLTSAQRYHFQEATLGDEINGRDAEASAQDSVVRRGRAAALSVTQNGDADFLLGALSDRLAN